MANDTPIPSERNGAEADEAASLRRRVDVLTLALRWACRDAFADGAGAEAQYIDRAGDRLDEVRRILGSRES